MDIVIKLLIFSHIFGLVLGMGAGFAARKVGPMIAGAEEPSQSALFKVAKMLSSHGNMGLAILWVSGILIVLLKYQGVASLGVWFWAKMACVVVLSAGVGIGGAALRRAISGDFSAMPRVRLAGMVSGLSGVAAILCAVFAFL